MEPLLALYSTQLHHPLPGDLGQVADFDLAPGSGTVEGWIQADWSTVPGYDPAIFADRNRGQRRISVGRPSFSHGERIIARLDGCSISFDFSDWAAQVTVRA